jgi:hypothetical protein
MIHPGLAALALDRADASGGRFGALRQRRGRLLHQTRTDSDPLFPGVCL